MVKESLQLPDMANMVLSAANAKTGGTDEVLACPHRSSVRQQLRRV